MEHIVQFGISIDDEMIQKRIVDNAERTVTAEIQKKVESEILTRSNYYGGYRNSLSEAGEDIICKWLESHKDEIIELAASKVAEKVSRSKAWKEKYGEVTAE